MNDLPLPKTQTNAWQIHGNSAYLPLNLIIGGGSAGRKNRQVYNRFGVPLQRHKDFGFAVAVGYFMAEARLVNHEEFVDLWQVQSVTKTNAVQALVTMRFCVGMHNKVYDPIQSVTGNAQLYSRICEDAAKRVLGN